MNFIKYLICCMLLVVGLGLSAVTASAGVLAAPIDDEPASQIVSYYNSEDDSEFVLQVTNTNVSSAVTVHIQTIQTDKSKATPVCVEVKNFFHTFTQADTEIFGEAILGIPDNTEGLIIINAVTGPGSFVPSDFPHLIGHAWIVNEEDDPASSFAVLYNSAGRDFAGGVFDLLQPVNVLSPYDNLTLPLDNDVNIASATWTDVYTAAGAYIASTGTATATGNVNLPVGVFVFDELEVPISCGNLALACATCTGISDSSTDTDEGDICLNEENQLCSDAPDSGFAAFIGLDSVDNLFVLVGQELTNVWAGMDYAVTVGEQEPVIPPVENCSNGTDDDGDGDIDCADSDCAASVSCAEGGAGSCDDAVDNDGDGDVDCADEDCDGVAGCEFGNEASCGDSVDNDADGATDCADDDCSESTLCQEEGGGGGGGGCSVAGSSVGLANALLLLIPAIGIAIRRRLIG